MQKNLVSLMLLVVAVTSANLDPTQVVDEIEWIPINYRIDPRMRRQVPSTEVNEDTAASSDVPIIDGTSLLKELETIKSPTANVRQGTSSLTLPIDTSAISLNACIFIGLEIKIIINILDPVACSRICARDSNCTHFSHKLLENGGTCTLHSAPGSSKDGLTTVSGKSGATCGQIPKKNCVSSDGSLINLCLDLALKISLGVL
ncbi:hypothetical protein GHT06_010888 [Daphnia sinensis]|uniref:Apple domain-containing protein n=1 Tax=Daphnia sinensis TaxID=1820382 RepID=A0AAD5LIM3_9CRUS|nr:hypothetical protein GHT06_010888 [Daphnia sinensis]